MENGQSAGGERPGGNWPRYDAAVLGFRHYWYPVLFAREVGRRPLPLTLLGEQIVLVREGDEVYALRDRCPHRGIPLSLGRRECPGTLSCAYHGWTYDLASGELAAVLTDRPDSPIVGKASVRVPTYPTAIRAGLVWVYVGDAPAPPVEADVPAELLEPGRVVDGVALVRRGNWRYAAENGMDEGHARYLHRPALWTLFRKMPAWTRYHTVPGEGADAGWLVRVRDDFRWDDTYPRVGRWPRRPIWQNRAGGSSGVALRLPCQLRNRQFGGGVNFEFYVPVDADHYRRILLVTKRTSGLDALRFRAWYRLYVRWVYHGQFNAQDQAMIERMDTPPERLYAPDASITTWRRWCHEHTRQGPPTPALPAEQAVPALATTRAGG